MGAIVAVVTTSLLVPAGAQPTCPLRNCLPPDDTQDPPLCYTQTPATQKPATQAFGKCPADRKFCEFCTTEPPCESRCRSEPLAGKIPGAACLFDEECRPPFAKCLQRVCKRALHTFQSCNPDDPNDVCIFGQKSCFRNRCQGLREDEPCFEGHEAGRDIDCNPGWYCYLAVCTAQLPAGHSCSGQHPHECVRGYRCNLALAEPVCVRQYTLNMGETSGNPSLCKSNHVNPQTEKCDRVPDVELRFGKPVVGGRDCTADSQCPRKDGSLGTCSCKQWWDGRGTPGYCELYVQESNRPAFKRFWEAGVRLCHQDWTDERCARETDLVEVLGEINEEKRGKSNDPTTVAECGRSMLLERDMEAAGGALHKAVPFNFAGMPGTVILAAMLTRLQAI
mmetsp:Transcript_144499/g.255271  ORF Transcript_144499/g.255271 Transcript_144499/m.255271 type:complete len:393 (+) Transcript_144499:83-1261(+)